MKKVFKFIIAPLTIVITIAIWLLKGNNKNKELKKDIKEKEAEVDAVEKEVVKTEKKRKTVKKKIEKTKLEVANLETEKANLVVEEKPEEEVKENILKQSRRGRPKKA